MAHDLVVAAMIFTLLIAVFSPAILALAWHWRPRGTIEPGARALLVAFGIFSALALVSILLLDPDRPPGWFEHCKPTIFYWTLAAILIVAPMLGCDRPVKSILGPFLVLTPGEWRWVNLAFAVAFLLLGGANLEIAFTYPEDDWQGFKWGCMVNVIGVILLRFAMVWVEALGQAILALAARRKAKP